MTARSRPRALMAPLKVAITSAPEAVRITSATAPTPIPTAPGWLLRQWSETTVAIPTTTATTRNQVGCSSHVSTSVAAPTTVANTYIVAFTTRSRRPRGLGRGLGHDPGQRVGEA